MHKRMIDNLNPLLDTETPLRLSLGPLTLIRIQKHHINKSYDLITTLIDLIKDKQVKCLRETRANALNSGFVFNIKVKFNICCG